MLSIKKASLKLIIALQTSISFICAQENCHGAVEHPANGELQCQSSGSDSMECMVKCFPGFLPYPKSVTSCSMSSGWTTSPSDLKCSPSILLLAGSGWSPLINKVSLFSLNLTCPTKSLPDMPEWNFGHTLDYVDGNIIMCGSDWDRNLYHTCYIMVENNTWEVLPYKLNKARKLHNSAVFGSRLFMIGGSHDSSKSNTEVIDLTESVGWKSGFDLIQSVYEGCTVSLSDGRIAVLGGQVTAGDTAVSMHHGVIIYNSEDGHIQQLPHMAVPRKEFGCAAFTKNGSEFIMATGGYSYKGCLFQSCIYIFWDTTEILEIGSDHWRAVDSVLPEKSGIFHIENIEGKIIGLDGYGIFEFDIEKEAWTEVHKHVQDHVYANPQGMTAVPAERFGCV